MRIPQKGKVSYFQNFLTKTKLFCEILIANNK